MNSFYTGSDKGKNSGKLRYKPKAQFKAGIFIARGYFKTLTIGKKKSHILGYRFMIYNSFKFFKFSIILLRF